MRVTASHLVEMPTEKVIALCRGHYPSMVALAEADALYDSTRVATRRWLRSPEMVWEWRDALYGATTATQIHYERSSYARTGGAGKYGEDLQRLRDVCREAESLDRRFAAERWEQTWAAQVESSATYTARAWLKRYRIEEFRELYRSRLEAVGLPRPPSPRKDIDPPSLLKAIERCYKSGDLRVEDPPEELARLLVGGSPAQFLEAVEEDARTVPEKIEGLRHPLVLGRWEKELRTLLHAAGEHAGLNPPHGTEELDMPALWNLSDNRASWLLGRRRVYLMARQRLREVDLLTRRYQAAIKEQHKEALRPYGPHNEAATDDLVNAHMMEYAHIRARVVGELGLADGETLISGGSAVHDRRSHLRRTVFAELDELDL